MADNWTDWYSGSMAPPDKLPGGGYSRALESPGMSPEEFYQGIYGEPLQLTSRSVNTVPIDPSTGMPRSAARTVQSATGPSGRGPGNVRPFPRQSDGTTYYPRDGGQKYGYNSSTQEYEIKQPGNAYTSVPAPKFGPNKPNTAVAAIDQATTGLGRVPYGTRLNATSRDGKVAAMRGTQDALSAFYPPSDGIIDLSALDPTESGAQGMADSQGQPIRVKGGKVYYPGGKAPSGNVQGTLGRDTRGPLSQVLGLKSSGLGGLLAGLFGGGGQQGGGGLAGLLGGMGGPSPGPIMTGAPRANLSSSPAVAQLQQMGMTPQQAYENANSIAAQRAIQNSSNPSANAARASLASQWGFD